MCRANWWFTGVPDVDAPEVVDPEVDATEVVPGFWVPPAEPVSVLDIGCPPQIEP